MIVSTWLDIIPNSNLGIFVRIYNSCLAGWLVNINMWVNFTNKLFFALQQQNVLWNVKMGLKNEGKG